MVRFNANTLLETTPRPPRADIAPPTLATLLEKTQPATSLMNPLARNAPPSVFATLSRKTQFTIRDWASGFSMASAPATAELDTLFEKTQP